MKKTINYLVIMLVSMLAFYSCSSETEFDESLLIGKWKSGTEYYRYDFSGTGVTWDTADDVTEAEQGLILYQEEMAMTRYQVETTLLQTLCQAETVTIPTY
jgi:hypothetical protein